MPETVIENLKIRAQRRKIAKLEKEVERYRKLYRKEIDFEYAFRKFAIRVKDRKYDSHWPIQRFDEAIHNLLERLD